MQWRQWWLVFALVPCACAPRIAVVDDHAATSESGSPAGDSSGGETIASDGSEATGGETIEATTTGDATAGGSGGSSSTGNDCDDDDECRTAEDCPLSGSFCVDCTCHGGQQCEEWGEGTWEANCIAGEACGSQSSECSIDDPGEVGACMFPCDDICDCPPNAPYPAYYQKTCGPIGDGDPVCYISCENGEACPYGWSCIEDTWCGIPMPPRYHDCFNYAMSCPPADAGGTDGTCLDVPAPADGSADEGGICSTASCIDAADCPDAPATGSATVSCTDVLGNDMRECVLDCSLGQTCPDGATCHAELGLCYFEDIVVGPYDACAGLYQDCYICLAGDESSVCAPHCFDVDDCPPVPPGGTASLVCDPFFGMCLLQCGLTETCPDDMVCFGGVCLTPA